MKLYINTFGEFDIKMNGRDVLEQSSRTYKIYKLFKYFITLRNKKLLAETIIDNLLSDNDSDDPKNMLRTQIFRLRKIIKALLPQNADESKYLTINFSNGYYSLEVGENTVIDVDEFENLIKQGDLVQKNDAAAAANYYEKAINLYRGLYMADNPYEIWLVSARNYYQRLYLKTFYKLIDILKKLNESEKIVTLCEEALLIEPYEENIHINLMEAMLAQKQQKTALNHYEYALGLLEKELDTNVSSKFIGMLKKIQNNSDDEYNTTVESIAGNIDVEYSGAMKCSMESFMDMVILQKRREIREDENDYLCLVTVNRNPSRYLEEVETLLRNILRKGDVYTIQRGRQILVMLHNVKDGGTAVIEKRIYDNLKDYSQLDKSDISVDFHSLSSGHHQ